MTFTGWPAEALDFYEGLEADNSKSYWTAHKATYEAAVRGPMQALSEAVANEFGPLHIFRPYRDVRFSKDKSPYKTAIGATTEGEGGELYYVQVSTTGVLAACGYYQMANDQLERYRQALDASDHGAEAAKVVADLEDQGYSIGAFSELKTAPRGYAKDHPRIRLLRLKGLIASRTFKPAAWMATPAALDRIVGTWRGCADLAKWLNRHVGPSRQPPAEVKNKITITPVFVADLLAEGERMPVYVHVIDHPDGRVLVDTGMTELHPAAADLDPRLSPLSKQDFDLDGIDIVVNTHLHFDHCGGNHLFAGKPIYVQRLELNDARSQDDYTIREWVDALGVQYVPVDGEFELLPGLRLVPAPGHTRGLQMVVIETGGRPLIVGGDVAVWFGELDEPHTEGQLRVLALDPELVWLTHEHEPWRPPHEA